MFSETYMIRKGMVTEMRIKLDGELFQEEEIGELIGELEKKEVNVQTVKKNRASHKGVIDKAEIISWIVIVADAFLPMMIDVIYSYIKEHKKEKALIDIEQRGSDGQQKKITVFTDKEFSSLDIQAKENGDIHIFVTKER